MRGQFPNEMCLICKRPYTRAKGSSPLCPICRAQQKEKETDGKKPKA